MKVGNFTIEIKGTAKADSTPEDIVRLSEYIVNLIAMVGHDLDRQQTQVVTYSRRESQRTSKDGFPGYPAE